MSALRLGVALLARRRRPIRFHTVERFRVMRAFPRAVAVACFVLVTRQRRRTRPRPPRAVPRCDKLALPGRRASLDTAEPLYREALEKGGLAPTEVARGLRSPRIRSAHRSARRTGDRGLPRGEHPRRASSPSRARPARKGARYAAQAKKDTANIRQHPAARSRRRRKRPSGKSFTVTATLDGAHIADCRKHRPPRERRHERQGG